MKLAQVPKNGFESVKGQREYTNLNILPDADFNDIAGLASNICRMPASAVCVVDNDGNFLKTFNIPVFSSLPVVAPITDGAKNVFIVSDLSKDERYNKHPYVTGVLKAVFYAGIPVSTEDRGFTGTLCVIDTAAGQLAADQVSALQALGRQLSAQIHLRQCAKKLADLKTASVDLAKIAQIASHDLKSPLNNIISLTRLLKEDYGTGFDEAGNEYINYLNDAAYQLSDLCNGILNFARSSQLAVDSKEDIDLTELAGEIRESLNIPDHVTIDTSNAVGSVHTARAALKQVLMHLVQNGIKYLNNTPIVISLAFTEDDAYYFFDVKDNGTTIAKEEKEKIFALFAAGKAPANEPDHMGIDLAITKRIAEKLGGTLTVDSSFAVGMSFTVTLPK